ncbi:MAG: hypothetical protein HY973_02765 [Candidatus Kerfeldbacteria bacterium]|nr:hypothetical protein [Candidatus Kerfeldbacteria bacterium]
MVQIGNSPLLNRLRLVLAEVAIGLLFSWWLLLGLELIRPGSVSLYLDLNLILVLGIVGFALGKSEAKQPRAYTKLQLLVSGIMVVWLIVVLL